MDENQTTLDQFFDKEFIRGTHDEEDEEIEIITRQYNQIEEGTIVRNIYSKKDYKVVRPSCNNIVEIFDAASGYLTLARSDLEVVM